MSYQIKDISFSDVSEKDWPLLFKLERTTINDHIYQPITNFDDFRKYFLRSTVFKVNLAQKTVGYCAYQKKEVEAEITGLLVVSKFRKKGIGELMLIKMLKDLGKIKRIKLITNPKNAIALRLYLKYGFIISDLKKNYWQRQPRLILYKV